MRCGDDGAVTGWAALRLYRAGFFDGLANDGRTRLPVPLVTPRKLSDTAESITSRVSLEGHRIWLVQGIRCVGVERAVVDEIWPETGVAGEYDGALHRDRSRHRTDVARSELMRGHGVEPFVIVAGDGPEVQIARMVAARERAAARSVPRSWTLEPPAWAPEPPALSLDDELEIRRWVPD
ncbi:hypothetical protein [Nocardioides pelophilus]|uniref:hypothetical protein n=1 Tax=Nocardioides pelophilus TaxID=2172019 RepID=UPI0016030059|nr:hypothetical protein [Nocardioides pelophilus]